MICDSIYPDDTEECKECKDGGELITLDLLGRLINLKSV